MTNLQVRHFLLSKAAHKLEDVAADLAAIGGTPWLAVMKALEVVENEERGLASELQGDGDAA